MPPHEEDPVFTLAVRISDYLHTLDTVQALGWHMARGLSEHLASHLYAASEQERYEAFLAEPLPTPSEGHID